MTFDLCSARAIGALSAGMLALGMLAGCTPAPEPKPTKTALFASDEEAFKAAEETYRAYLHQLNATDLSDDSTFEPVFDWLTGSALASEKESLSFYYAEQLERTGETRFDSFTPLQRSGRTVTANLCLDVSEVDLLSTDGVSVLTDERANRRALKVTFVHGDTETGLMIQSNHEPESFSC